MHWGHSVAQEAGVGVNAILLTASKLVEPAGERYAGVKCSCPWMPCGRNVCEQFVMASRRSCQYAAAAVASASAESEFILSIEEIVENQKASGEWMADSIVVETFTISTQSTIHTRYHEHEAGARF